MAYYGQWAPYVPVAERRRRAMVKMAQMRKKGVEIQPVEIEGRKISKTFWGQAWCDHMESLGDYANRLPRGRTYVRNGSICHLAIEKGRVKAIVSGSSLYNVDIKVKLLPRTRWNAVKSRCAGQIGTLLELLQGRLSENVMQVVTDPASGLFPLENQIEFGCSCPDWAIMCKHVAAVLYGVGARLDRQPEHLFLLRGVRHEELIEASPDKVIRRRIDRGGRRTLASAELSDVFGIEVESAADDDGVSDRASAKTVQKSPKKKTARKRPTARKPTTKEPAPAKTKRKASATKSVKKAAVKKAAKKGETKEFHGRKVSTPAKKSSKRTMTPRAAKKTTKAKRKATK